MQLLNGRLILSPSDLNDHVECEHLTTLKRQVACGDRKRPHVPDEATDLLRRKGEQHEAAYLAELRAAGREVVDVRAADPWDFDTAARNTERAMRDGVDVIYQATFADGGWRGRADFLERVARPTTLGAWGYEPLDTKLARTEKPTYVLQLCFYSDGIARVQGEPPERMHVLLGIGERRTLRHDDFAAYFRRVRASFEAAVAGRRATEPYPVEHCGLCDFRGVCDEWWSQQDHLSLVANIRRDQTLRLADAGLTTLTHLATAPPDAPVDLAPHTFETLREQAELQRIRGTTGDLTWRLIPPEPGRGFALLPRASTGDIVFDIEGHPFWEPSRGLHFLLGLWTTEGREDAPVGYHAFWAHDRAEERRAFEALIDFFTERLARHPDMHVYHYGAYEPAAIKQLMSVYATREDAVDALLRRETFVNLLTVVRQALRAGVPSYSLKETEKLADFARKADVASGTRAVLEYERWMDDRAESRLEAIRVYNEEDCRATLALRDWLLRQRPASTPWPETAEQKEIDEETLAEREALRRALVDGTAEGSPRWLAGELLAYHRREARPVWWWSFARMQLSLDELFEDAESIARLERAGRARPDKQSM
ncbi:MAG: TM0106 family RecB-like putative nuclease, partial [Candidatus Rokubacteria bacterium]|nr:TM0106 family RecB-like putative nuclease [Candidatus Rokubacteria bacterium]